MLAALTSLALASALVPAVAVQAFAAEAEEAGAAVLRVLSSDEVTASGTSGTVTWMLYSDGELVIAPTSGSTGTLDSFSGDEDGAPWYTYRYSIYSVIISGTVVCGSSLAYMFYNCSSLETLDLSSLDTSSVTSMSYMFSGCTALQSLDLSPLDTSLVTDMCRMFYNCTALRTVTLGEGFSFTGDGTMSCELPSPVDDEYGTGWWVDDSGNVYEDPADIPSNVAATYTAAFAPKKAQSFKVKAKKAVTVKYKKLKKKAQSVKASRLCKVTGAKGTLTYSKVSVKRNGKKVSNKVAKKITVSKAGKVTLKKGLAKGTYKVKLKVRAKATLRYKASAAKAVTVTIKVK